MAVAAAALPGSDVTITHVGLNPSRAALLDVLRRFGADVETTVEDEWNGEPVGRAADSSRRDARPRDRAGRSAGGDRRAARAGDARHVRRQRHACPAPASCASRKAIASRSWSRDCARWAPTPTSGPTASRCDAARRLTGGTVHARHDHRLAMAFAIAALGATGPDAHRGRRRGGRVVSRVLRGPRSARASGRRSGTRA